MALRSNAVTVAVEDRIKDFREVEKTFSQVQAYEEANR